MKHWSGDLTGFIAIIIGCVIIIVAFLICYTIVRLHGLPFL